MSRLTPITLDDFESFEELGVRDGTSPEEWLEVDTSRATRRYLITPWEARFDAAVYFLGDVAIDDSGAVPVLNRLLPQRHPVLSDLIATKVAFRGFKSTGSISISDVVGIGGPGDAPYNQFDGFIAEVTFEHAPFLIYSDDEIADLFDGDETQRYVENPCGISNAGGEAITLPAGSMKLVEQTSNRVIGATPTNISVLRPMQTFRVCWHWLPFEITQPGGALFDRVYQGFGGDDGDGGIHGSDQIPMYGCVNDGWFLGDGSSGSGYPPGTVLFNGMTVHRRRSPRGIGWIADVEFEFIFSPKQWNKLLFPGPGDPAHPDDVNRFWYASKSGIAYTPDSQPDYDSMYFCRPLQKLFSLEAPD